MENKGLDPFEVDINEILENLKKYLPNWNVFEDFTLDAEAINRISSIIRLQGGWIKYRSSSLYVDPLLIELKIRMIEQKDLVDVFLKSWHPIIKMEQLSQKRIKESIDYWNLLLPLDDRLMKLPDASAAPGVTTLEEMINSRLMSEESFDTVLQRFYAELKEAARSEGKVSYWDFIQDDTYENTVYRAYLTSFLVTYGYTSMEVNPIEEEAFLIPFEEPKNTPTKKQTFSIPIAIDYDLWKNMKEMRKA
ncbi:MAG: hypothetical protein V1850_04415 [Candidatus Bathyarchaeota archaeon]